MDHQVPHIHQPSMKPNGAQPNGNTHGRAAEPNGRADQPTIGGLISRARKEQRQANAQAQLKRRAGRQCYGHARTNELEARQLADFIRTARRLSRID